MRVPMIRGKARVWVWLGVSGIAVLALLAGTGRPKVAPPPQNAYQGSQIQVKRPSDAATIRRARIMAGGMALQAEGTQTEQDEALLGLRRSLQQPDAGSGITPLPPPPMPTPDRASRPNGLFPDMEPATEPSGWGWLADEVLQPPAQSQERIPDDDQWDATTPGGFWPTTGEDRPNRWFDD